MHKTKVVPPESHAQASCGAWRGREAADPVDDKHPYPSMAHYAELFALRFDAKRTRHAYYRAMRLLHEHFPCDPATLEETSDYLLHIKLHKHWKPKTIRQTLACAKLFFVLGQERKPAGSGAAALKYLGAYVARTALSDGRIFAVDERGVTFRWKDRSDHNRSKLMTLTDSEFVRRYLRHVLPCGLRSIRYYGFCHPAAKAKRQRMQIHTGMPFDLNSRPSPPGCAAEGPNTAPPGASRWPRCPTCAGPMR